MNDEIRLFATIPIRLPSYPAAEGKQNLYEHKFLLLGDLMFMNTTGEKHETSRG